MPRFIALYLCAYLLVVGGAAVTLWRSGLIEHLHRGWTLAVLGGALLLGLLLALLSKR